MQITVRTFTAGGMTTSAATCKNVAAIINAVAASKPCDSVKVSLPAHVGDLEFYLTAAGRVAPRDCGPTTSAAIRGMAAVYVDLTTSAKAGSAAAQKRQVWESIARYKGSRPYACGDAGAPGKYIDPNLTTYEDIVSAFALDDGKTHRRDTVVPPAGSTLDEVVAIYHEQTKCDPWWPTELDRRQILGKALALADVLDGIAEPVAELPAVASLAEPVATIAELPEPEPEPVAELPASLAGLVAEPEPVAELPAETFDRELAELMAAIDAGELPELPAGEPEPVDLEPAAELPAVASLAEPVATIAELPEPEPVAELPASLAGLVAAEREYCPMVNRLTGQRCELDAGHDGGCYIYGDPRDRAQRDRRALDAIAVRLSGHTWTPDDLDFVGQIVASTGRPIADVMVAS